MSPCFHRSLLTFFLVLCGFADWSQAEIVVRVDRNSNDTTKAGFTFDKAPAPSMTDAANQATFTLVGSRRDRNSGELSCLHDGQLPRHRDDPSRNFFLAPGTSSGRLLLDLGRETEIHQVNSYSWHRGSRGPQVYTLYAAGTAQGEQLDTLDDTADPTALGWKLLAKVDSRSAEHAAGGQYAVSITDQQAERLGTYRYLIFDLEPTETDDRFGHTFYSEIDVLDGKQHEPPRGIELIKLDDGTEIVLDTTQLPELDRWVEEKLTPVCRQWYPTIVTMLPSNDFTAPRRFTIIFEKDMRGVAHASGSTIHCAGPWFMRNLHSEARGAVVHEMVHIVQQYDRSRRGNQTPSWLVEGIADYVRWFVYEPATKRPQIDPRRANYTDSYRTTGAFLHYVTEHHDEQIVKRLNAQLRMGTYDNDSWKAATGKSVEELWNEFAESLR